MSFNIARFTGVLTRTVLVVLGVELVLLALFELLWPSISHWHHVYFDIWVLAVAVSGTLYWCYIKPLDEQLHETLHALDEARRQAEDLAQHDALTGLLNRREFFARFEQEWQRSERKGLALACVMLDIDHFKQFNDQHGHLVGDAVLRSVAEVLARESRAFDIVGRYGGEEFCIVLPETELAPAAVQAERLRRAILGMQVPTESGDHLRVTASFGVAEKSPGTVGVQALTELADDALLVAKRTGRNRVETWQAAVLPSPALAGQQA